MRNILATIVATITGHPRYFPVAGRDFEWCEKAFVHNVFRVFELIFGAYAGIKPSMSTTFLEKEDGTVEVFYEFFTLEVVLAHVEGIIRQFFAIKKLGFKFVPLPALVTTNGSVRKPIIAWAIAFDNNADNSVGSGTATVSFNHTVAGSNTLMVAGVQAGSGVAGTGSVTAKTYNSVGMTATSSSPAGDDDGTLNFFYLVAPTTGTNSASFTRSIAVDGLFGNTVSYTGMAQTGQPDSSNSATNTGTSLACSNTVVGTGCWLVGTYRNGATGTPNSLSGGVLRGTATSGRIGDSNATVGTGSQSMTWGAASSGLTYIIQSSFAPAVDASQQGLEQKLIIPIRFFYTPPSVDIVK